jgi:hypothetical protein
MQLSCVFGAFFPLFTLISLSQAGNDATKKKKTEVKLLYKKKRERKGAKGGGAYCSSATAGGLIYREKRGD